jgi:hypothetical protein
MDIEGRRFRIRSVFPADTETTPTDRLLDSLTQSLKRTPGLPEISRLVATVTV